MKKIFLYSMMTVLFLTLTSLMLYQVDSSGKKRKQLEKATSIPDDLKTVFNNSCMDCHGAQGGKMAKAMLDLSAWDDLKHSKQVKKAAAICKIVSKGDMPPRSYREKNPGKVPSDTQKKLICKWSETLAHGH